MRIEVIPLLVLSILLPVLTGCSFLLPYTEMEGGRLFPKPPRFSIIPSSEQNKGDVFIDYNALYSWIRIWKYEGITHTNYFNLRFWPTGKCAVCFPP